MTIENMPKKTNYLLLASGMNIDEIIMLNVDGTIKQQTEHPGGCGANTAFHAGNLGVTTALLSAIGNDYKLEWQQKLVSSGVDLSRVRHSWGPGPRVKVYNHTDGTQHYEPSQLPTPKTLPLIPPVQALDDITNVLHVGTGPLEYYIPFMQHAKQKGLTVTLDPGPEIKQEHHYNKTNLDLAFKYADTIFVNEKEYAILQKITTIPPNVAVITTLGEKGLAYTHPEYGNGQLPAIPVEKVIDPTGAGDALRAGYYAALYHGKTWLEALQCGQKTAALNIQHLGAQTTTITWDQINTI